MKLHENVAKCNSKFTRSNTDTSSVGHFIGKGARSKTSINAKFLDATDNHLPTSIDLDNVLVLGSNNSLNQELALLIQRVFGKVSKISKLISASNFFTIPPLDRVNKHFYYIVICDDLDIESGKLAQLRRCVSTVCSFKIPGLEWKLGEFGQFDISDRAQSILNALNIKTDISKGLLASLDQREFCLMTSKNLFKRRV
ncbi:hypothetical protein N9N97_02870 [Rickettsiaceae bacterium]|nr:hypothetical protein [Rickettsiaceae bacterium]